MTAQRAGVVAVEDVHRVEHMQGLGHDAGLFQQFARGRGFDGFTGVDLAARKGPAVFIGRVRAAHQQHVAVADDGGDGGGNGGGHAAISWGWRSS
ncbi:hypothetical protein D3C72_2020410 [compost metagenome]